VTFSGSAEVIPSVFEFVDIAGLVAGARKGDGLGNPFLGHVREARLIVWRKRAIVGSAVRVRTGDPRNRLGSRVRMKSHPAKRAAAAVTCVLKVRKGSCSAC
jgi:hypothetical protein